MKKLITLIIVGFCLVSLCFASPGWDNTLPADSSDWDDAAGYIRDNWDAMEVIWGEDLADAGAAENVFNVKETAYGAIGDGDGAGGGTNDSTAIQAAIDAAEAAEGVAYIPPGTYRIDTGLTLDAGRASLIGDGVILDCSSMTSTKYALSVYSSRTAPANFYNNINRSVKGISIFGDNTTGVHGLKLGHVTYVSNNEINFENVSVYKCDRDIEFINNSWRYTFRNCGFYSPANYQIYWPASLSNSGEQLSFYHCIFANGQKPISINSTGANAQFEFYSCSFLDSPIVISGGAKLRLFGGNMENPQQAATDYRMITISGSSIASLYGTNIWLQEPTGANWEMAPFLNNATGGGGLLFSGVYLPLRGTQTWWKPETDDDQRVWVAGTGRTIVQSTLSSNALTTYDYTAICANNNLLDNGDFEDSTGMGWYEHLYASRVTYNATSKRSGTYGAHFSSAGTIAYIYQQMPIKPGQTIMAGCWIKAVSGTGAIKLIIFDPNGVTLTEQTDTHTTSTFTYSAVQATAPVESSHCRVYCYTSASSEIYYDDVICNTFSEYGAGQTKELMAAETWDPGSIGDHQEEMQEVTVYGAQLGDYARASFSVDVADLQLTADVTATNTVTVVLSNSTQAAVDLASGTLRVKVEKQ